jgi:uncharacterized cupin superfamily protein
MKEISARWYEWSRYAPDRHLDEHGHFLVGMGGQPGVVVDPVAFQEGDREQIADLGGAGAVVLTGPARADDAERCARVLGCPVVAAYANPAVPLAAGLLAIPVPVPDAPDAPHAPDAPELRGDARREVALCHRETATALVGASVVGHPAGALCLAGAVPAPPAGALPVVAAQSGESADPAAARTARALRGLLGGRVETLLVGAGTSLVHQPMAALQDLVYRHDPAAMILRPDELHWTPPAGLGRAGTRFASRAGECARLLGLRTLDFQVTEVPPGRQGGQIHRHDGQEELFVVLAGRGELVTEHGTYPIQAGDLLGFPPRYQIAHAFRNTGDVTLRYLAFGTATETLEMLDYIESGVRAEFTRFGKGYRFRLPDERHIPYWEGVPAD